MHGWQSESTDGPSWLELCFVECLQRSPQPRLLDVVWCSVVQCNSSGCVSPGSAGVCINKSVNISLSSRLLACLCCRVSKSNKLFQSFSCATLLGAPCQYIIYFGISAALFLIPNKRRRACFGCFPSEDSMRSFRGITVESAPAWHGFLS